MRDTIMGMMGDYVYGYVNGEQFNITNTPEQIAAFIVKHRFENVRIVSVLDVMLITTSSGTLDYVADQEYLKEELLPVLVPMQQGDTEPVDFIPYGVTMDDSVIMQKDNVEFKETKFNVVVTKEPVHIIHILELEGTPLVTDVINTHWQEALIQLLELPQNDEYGDEIYYLIYCYCYEGPVILEYGYDGETGPLFTQVDESEPVWTAFKEFMENRKTIENLINQILKNQNVISAEFTGYNDQYPEFQVILFDRIKENWEVREENEVYYYDKNEDEWKHAYRLEA